MQKTEKEIQKYIWEHKDEFWDMVEEANKPSFPEKDPWEYEPWELIYHQVISDYFQSASYLKTLNLFGCEVGLPKDGESTIRTDLLGCLEGVNGFVVCELKVNRQPERQAFTELFAYSNVVRNKIAPMGRKDIVYLLISPMEERIVREATICNLIYERNSIVAFVPEWNKATQKLKLKLWVPEMKEFNTFTKTAFAFKNIDTFKVTWRWPGKWSPIIKGAKPDGQMIHQLNQVSAYAAQLMEASSINGFVYCSQLYPQWRDAGFIENGLVICGINPYKAAKTKLLYEHGETLKDAAETDVEALSIFNLFPHLKDHCLEANEEVNYWYLMSENWCSALDDIAFNVRNRLTTSFNAKPQDTDYGSFTWDSFLNNSIEDMDCWNYDIHLTGLLREFYDCQLELKYSTFQKYSTEQKSNVAENGYLKPHYIDMLNSQEHVREFLKSLTEGDEDDVIDKPLDGEILWQNNYFANVFAAPEEIDFI